MLNWLVHDRGIEPRVALFDKSKRTDGTFSREDFIYPSDTYRCPGGKILLPQFGENLRRRRVSGDADTPFLANYRNPSSLETPVLLNCWMPQISFGFRRVSMLPKPMLHIVFGESAGGTLRLALRQAGRGDEVLSFNDDLSFGPIDTCAPIVRAAWARTELYFPDAATAALADASDRFWHRARSAQKRVVWFSRRTAREHCGVLELVSQMGRRPYEVIDLSGLEIRFPTRGGVRVKRMVLSLAELSPDLVSDNALWDCAAPLSAVERRRYRRSWQRLRRENAPFRVVKGDIVISASAEIYDDMLLSSMTADWCSAARVIATAMAESVDDPGHQPGDLVLFGRLRKLIDAGKLDARGDLATLRGTEVCLSQR